MATEEKPPEKPAEIPPEMKEGSGCREIGVVIVVIVIFVVFGLLAGWCGKL